MDARAEEHCSRPGESSGQIIGCSHCLEIGAISIGLMTCFNDPASVTSKLEKAQTLR